MKRTSLVINNSIRKENPEQLFSKGMEIAMQFYCNVLLMSCTEENFQPAGEIGGSTAEFFEEGNSRCQNLRKAVNACSRIAGEIRFQKYIEDAPPAIAIKLQFFFLENPDPFYILTVGFYPPNGAYRFSSFL